MTLIHAIPPLEGSQRPGGSQLVLRVIISPPTARAVVYVFNSKLSPGLPRFYYNCRWIPCLLLTETKREINFRKQSHKGLVNDVAPISRGTRVGCKLASILRSLHLRDHIYEGWNFNSGNYLFTTDTK